MTKAEKISIRKKVFNEIKEVGRTISKDSKLYDVKKDFGKLPESHKNKLAGGVKLYNEPVIKFTSDSEQLKIFSEFEKAGTHENNAAVRHWKVAIVNGKLKIFKNFEI